MPFDKKEQFDGYLYNVLSEGVKLFRYRSAVRTLLGLPVENEGGLSFLQNLSPVGFRYSNNASISDGVSRCSSSLQRQERFWASSNNDISGTGTVDSIKEFDLSGKKVLVTSENVNPHEDPGKSKIVQKTPKQAVGNKEANEHEISNVDFSIPGKSTQKQSFPALKASSKSGVDTPGENISLMTSSNFQASEGEKADCMKSTPSVHQQNEPSSQLESFSQNNQQKTLKSKTKGQWTETAVLLSKKNHVDAIHKKNISLTRFENEQKTTGFSAPIKHGLETRIPLHENGSRLAHVTLDQLRQSVHSLVSKVTKPEEKIEGQDQQIMQPPVFTSSQEVVIFSQSTNRSRAPRAFWERSYLGRLHLNILR